MQVDATLRMSPKDLEAAAQLSVARTRPPAPVPGYVIEKFLGRGSFGEVWVARDENTGRRVAIKFFAHRGGLDWSLLSREVEKLRFLFNNRFVVQLLEVGWDAKPPYYVMEYFEHGSLEEYLSSGPLPVPTAQEIFREVAQALAHSHQRGVLHCDLKPGNILLDDELRPRLADFGQARLISEASPALGTLFYMAPEQADPEGVPHARWDVYALGAILYRMVTGKAPYQTPDLAKKLEEARDFQERLAMYRRAVLTAQRPTAHRKVRGMDRSLANIIDRCLAVDPKRRYSNPQAVLTSLDNRLLARTRRPLLIIGGLIPFILLLILAGIAWNSFSTTISSTRRTLTERANASNRFAAQFVATTVANEFAARWRVLADEAADPELRTLLNAGSNPAARKSLQQWIEARHLEHANETRATSWFLNDARGIQVARSPLDTSTILKDYSWRDYFHGQGKNFPEGTTGLEPVTGPHLSISYVSRATGTRMIAFSVPVWSHGPREPGRRVLGVLAMTVETGGFGELKGAWSMQRADHAAAVQFAVLVDTRIDSEGRRGLILQHPTPRDPADAAAMRDATIAEPLVNTMLELRQQKKAGAAIDPARAVANHFQDPVGGEFAGDWLIAFEPVELEAVGDTGLMVIVQDRREDVTGPITELEKRLVRAATIGLALIVAFFGVTWWFIVGVTTATSGSTISMLLRRAGFPGGSGGSASSQVTGSLPSLTDPKAKGSPGPHG